MEMVAAEYLAGHRERLHLRLEESGAGGFLEYEIIELLLSYAIARKDVKPLAKELLRHYRSIGALLAAPPDELQAFAGVGKRTAHLFTVVREVAALALRERVVGERALTDRTAVEEYLRFHFGHRRDEYVVALLLSSAHVVIGIHEIGAGTVNQCAVYPRVVLEAALKAKAAFVILAHNHPGGSANASEADWAVTDRLVRAGKLLDLPLLDHLIIVKDRVVSLREHARWPV